MMEIDTYKKLACENLEKAIAYDFKEEIINFDTADPCDRFAIYQAVGIAEDNGYKEETRGYKESLKINKNLATKNRILLSETHADACPLIQKIFSTLYKEKYLVSCRKDSEIRGDTMNSVNTTLNKFLTPLKNKVVQMPGNEQWSKVKTVYLYYQEHDIYHEKLEKILDLLYVAYTIGNFIPCPVGCNIPRDFSGSTKDYWDLALYCIYKWYHYDPEQRDDWLVKLFGKNVAVEKYKGWLTSFGSWNNFVEANYLQDFTEWKTAPYGGPKEFWEGHFIKWKCNGKSGAEPETEEQIAAFSAHATEAIRARSRRMLTDSRWQENVNEN